MADLEPEKVVKRTDLPIGNSIHTRVLVTPQANVVYQDEVLRKKAEAFAYKVFVTAAAEEYHLLVNQADIKKAEEVNYEGLFTTTEGSRLPGFESSNSLGVQHVSNYARSVVRKQVREAHENARNIFKSIAGPGTNEDRLFETLDKYRESSQSQIKLLREVYKSRYRQDLWEAIQSDLSGPELTRARAYITGASYDEADAIAVLDIIYRYKDHELGKRITQLYRSRTKEEIEAFEKMLNGKYVSALKEQFALRQGTHPEASSVSIDSFYKRFLLKDSQIVVDGYRKDDVELISIAECYSALDSRPPKKHLFF